MPKAKYFQKAPSFPADAPVIDLSRISLSKLLANDVHESHELFNASTETGFFLLDLKDCEAGETVLDDAENAFDFSEKIFGLGQEELAKYIFTNSDRFLYGYKALGAMKHKDGSRDGVEIYGVGQDDMLGNTTTKRPNLGMILENTAMYRDFFLHAHFVIRHIMSHLDKHLGLEPGTFASLNSQDQPSATLLRALKAPPLSTGTPRTNLTGHTDAGSMTMLFNILGGLQILPPGLDDREENWKYVRPEPGCVVINLGDSMVQWSGGVLRSNIHRVTTAPGKQAEHPRYSMAYLLRPAYSSSMKRLRGGGIPPVEDGSQEEDVCSKEYEERRRDLVIAGNALPQSLGGGYPTMSGNANYWKKKIAV